MNEYINVSGFRASARVGIESLKYLVSRIPDGQKAKEDLSKQIAELETSLINADFKPVMLTPQEASKKLYEILYNDCSWSEGVDHYNYRERSLREVAGAIVSDPVKARSLYLSYIDNNKCDENYVPVDIVDRIMAAA